jgi:cyanophycinase
VRTREDAFEDRWVKAIDGAGAIYLSGGNPAHLAITLGGTPVWDAIVSSWGAGASLAGCSAGAMALSGYAVDLRHWSIHTDLQVMERVRVLPHFDRYSRWIPDFATRALRGADGVVLGIDETTALLGQAPEVGNQWFFRPEGAGKVWVVGASSREPVDEGITLTVS